jgi:hypothetical protein
MNYVMNNNSSLTAVRIRDCAVPRPPPPGLARSGGRRGIRLPERDGCNSMIYGRRKSLMTQQQIKNR